MSDGAAGAGSLVVELSIPVQADLIVLARLTTATVASRAGFGIEDIEDLRLAVEELCLSVVNPGDDGRLHLRFDVDGATLGVECRFEQVGTGAAVIAGAADEDDGLSLRILDALVDAHGRKDEEDGRYAWLRKRGDGDPGTPE